MANTNPFAPRKSAPQAHEPEEPAIAQAESVTGLSAHVQAMLADLDVPSPDPETGEAYDPDALVSAVLGVYGGLRVLRDRLAERLAGTQAKERELAEREARLVIRERKVAAFERLADGVTLDPVPDTPRGKSWWRAS